MAGILRWHVNDIVECIDKMQENKFDCIIFIEGKRGLGKSTLAYKISTRLKCGFAPNRDIHYSRDEVLKALAGQKERVIFADEMINVSFNRDFYESDQKILIKALNMYRDSKNIFIGCVPKFVTLDKQVQNLCKLKITVVRRGIAIIQTQIPAIYSKDPWDTKNNEKIESKWTAKGVKNPRYAQLTTVRGIMSFNDITEGQRGIYESIKQDKRNKIFAQQSGLDLQDAPNIVFYKNLLQQLKEGEMTQGTFAQIIKVSGKNYNAVRKRLNEMLREGGHVKRTKDLLKSHTNTSYRKTGEGFTFKKGVG